MKTIIISFSFVRGGAAIAARKFAQIANEFSSVECYCADRNIPKGLFIHSPNKWQYSNHFIKRLLSYFVLYLMKDNNPVKHSLNIFSSPIALLGLEKAKDFDSVLNVHWINNDTLSLWQLNKLPRNTVLTLHDEWLYCGSEHCSKYPNKISFQYENEDIAVKGINLNHLVWKIKLNQLKNRDDLIFTVPSIWMLERAKNSTILKNKDIRLLPNPIDTDTFNIQGEWLQKKTRQAWNTNDEDILVCFGAVDGNKNPIKGGDYLTQALKFLESMLEADLRKKIKIVLFGSNKKENISSQFKQINIGRIEKEQDMVQMYNAVDMVVIPSIAESFGQVAAECLACGTPVAAFECTGLKDIVNYDKECALAKPRDAHSLAKAIKKLIMMTNRERKALGSKGRDHVLTKFSTPVIKKMYADILKDAYKQKST